MGVVEDGHVLVRHLGAGADGEQQRVVLERSPAGGVRDLAVGVDPLERLLHPLGAGLASDLPERVASRAGARERLLHGDGPVAQLVVGREERDVDSVTHEAAQAQQPLDRRDPASADHHPEAVHGASLSRCGKTRTAERGVLPMPSGRRGATIGDDEGGSRSKVMIVGGGVAALEALMALHELAGGPRVAGAGHADPRVRLPAAGGGRAVRPRRGAPLRRRADSERPRRRACTWPAIESVDTARHRVSPGTAASFRTTCCWWRSARAPTTSIPGSVTIQGPGYTGRFRTVLRELDERRVRQVAFAVPPGRPGRCPSTSSR